MKKNLLIKIVINISSRSLEKFDGDLRLLFWYSRLTTCSLTNLTKTKDSPVSSYESSKFSPKFSNSFTYFCSITSLCREK